MKDITFNIYFITLLTTFSQLLTKLLEQVTNKISKQFKTLHAFSLSQPHITLTFTFYFSSWKWKQMHLDMICHPKAIGKSCPSSSSASSSSTQTLHTPALCTPACISTNFQVLSIPSSCTIAFKSPLLKFPCPPLPTFYCMPSVGGATGPST